MTLPIGSNIMSLIFVLLNEKVEEVGDDQQALPKQKISFDEVNFGTSWHKNYSAV